MGGDFFHHGIILEFLHAESSPHFDADPGFVYLRK
ncbi:hypothetical protein ACVWW1_001674 [Bradyrhizobium sp. JR3.5]